MDEIDMAEEQRRIYWQSVFAKLAEGFSMNASVPPPAEVTQTIKLEAARQGEAS